MAVWLIVPRGWGISIPFANLLRNLGSRWWIVLWGRELWYLLEALEKTLTAAWSIPNNMCIEGPCLVIWYVEATCSGWRPKNIHEQKSCRCLTLCRIPWYSLHSGLGQTSSSFGICGYNEPTAINLIARCPYQALTYNIWMPKPIHHLNHLLQKGMSVNTRCKLEGWGSKRIPTTIFVSDCKPSPGKSARSAKRSAPSISWVDDSNKAER